RPPRLPTERRMRVEHFELESAPNEIESEPATPLELDRGECGEPLCEKHWIAELLRGPHGLLSMCFGPARAVPGCGLPGQPTLRRRTQLEVVSNLGEGLLDHVGRPIPVREFVLKDRP